MDLEPPVASGVHGCVGFVTCGRDAPHSPGPGLARGAGARQVPGAVLVLPLTLPWLPRARAPLPREHGGLQDLCRRDCAEQNVGLRRNSRTLLARTWLVARRVLVTHWGAAVSVPDAA